MDFPLSYCPEGWLRLERLRSLYTEHPQDRIFARMAVPSKIRMRFAEKYPPGSTSCPDLEERLVFWDEFLSERASVNDDSIPSVYLSEMDQGLYGGIVGGNVQFLARPEVGWISSMVPPILQDWSGFQKLSINRESVWYQYYMRALDLFSRGGAGKFGTSHLILVNGLNFVFELFGATRTYLEILDNPEKVREAMNFAFELNLEVQRAFFEHIPLLEGGTCSNMGEWIPGRIVSESVDPFHMTSVDYFERWGREAVEKILGRFDGGVLHIHANGRHLLAAVSTIEGLKALYLLNDLHYPSAFSVLPQLKKRIGNIPVVVSAEYAEFVEALDAHRLLGGILYKVLNVPDVDTVRRVMDRVREYRV